MTEAYSNRKGIRYLTNEYEPPEHYSSMFIQDLSQDILGTFKRGGRSIVCKLEPEEPGFEAFIARALPSRRSRLSHELTDSVTGFLDIIAQQLAHYGIAAVELVTLTDHDNSEHHKLEVISGRMLKLSRKAITQTLPGDVSRQLNVPITNTIPRDKCFVYAFPPKLGGPKKYIRFLSQFASHGNETPYLRYLDKPLKEVRGYDPSIHQRAHDIRLWRLSRRFMWHHRQTSGEMFSAYYHVARYLKFKQVKVSFRDSIIEQFDAMIMWLAKQYGFSSHIQIQGLTPLAEVREGIDMFRKGTLEIDQVSRLT